MGETVTMPNPVDGSVSVCLGDRKVSLALNGRAARLILERTGINIYQQTDRLRDATPTELNQIVWALTQNKKNEPFPTLEEIEEDLSMDNMSEVTEGVLLAITPRQVRTNVGNALRKARAVILEGAAQQLSSDTSGSGPSLEPTSESQETSSKT